jgi:hypothetical protein
MFHANVMLAVNRQVRARNYVAMWPLQVSDPEGRVPESAYGRPHDNLKWLVLPARGKQPGCRFLARRRCLADPVHAACGPHDRAARLRGSH